MRSTMLWLYESRCQLSLFSEFDIESAAALPDSSSTAAYPNLFGLPILLAFYSHTLL